MKTIEINETYSGKRLDRFLISYFMNCSKNYIFKLLRLKKIKVNNVRVDDKYILKSGDLIQLYVSDSQYETMQNGTFVEKDNRLEKNNIQKYSDDFFLLIKYEDNSCLIVQKPLDMVVIEDEKEKKWVLTNFVRNYFYRDDLKQPINNENNLNNDKKEPANFNISPVHRIDRNTTGLVIFAKTYQSFKDFTELFKKRKIEKEYLAIVHGKLLFPKKIVLSLSKDEQENIVKVDEQNLKENSKISITNVTPLAITDEATLIRATIETGRTHQIRITLANTGHPVINDIKYGNKKLYENFSKKYGISYMFLLAYSLKFEDNLPDSIQNLSGKRIYANLPYFWEKILNNHFKISKNKLEELLENLRK